MITVKEQIELRNKILKGLDLAYERMVEFKRFKKSEIVILKDNKIVRIKP